MEKTYSQAEHEELIVLEIRKAIEHRATWMYLLLQEARKRGLEWDDFARPAIRETGCLGGQKRRVVLLMVVLAIVAAVVIVVLVTSKKKAKPSPQMQVTSLAPPIPTPMVITPIQPAMVQAPQMLQVRCSQCQNILQVKDIGVAMKVTCPFCSTALTVQSQKTATPPQHPQAQQQILPTIQQVSCPKCKTSFPVVKSEGPKNIQCPSCGLAGQVG